MKLLQSFSYFKFGVRRQNSVHALHTFRVFVRRVDMYYLFVITMKEDEILSLRTSFRESGMGTYRQSVNVLYTVSLSHLTSYREFRIYTA